MELSNENTNATHKTMASSSEVYIQHNLPPGNYSIHVEASSFQSYIVTCIHLNADQAANVDAHIAISSSNVTNVEVMDSQPGAEHADSSPCNGASPGNREFSRIRGLIKGYN